MPTEEEQDVDVRPATTAKKWATRIRFIVGFAILFGALALNVYNEFYPIPTERLTQISDEAYTSLEAELQRAKELQDETPESRSRAIEDSETVTSAKPDSYVVPALRFLSIMLGVILLYFAVFLFENESGKLQNRLEEWWIRTYDAQNTSLSKHLQFLRSLASLSRKGMDTIFGLKTLSLQTAGVSVCFALASANLYQYLNGWESPLENLIVNTIYWFLLGLVPALLHDWYGRFAWYVFLMTWIWNDFVNGLFTATLLAFWIGQPVMVAAFLSFFAGVVVACVLAFFSIGLIRFLLKKVSESGAFVSTVVWLILICVPGALFYQPWYALNLVPLSGGDSLVIGSLAVLFSVIVVNSFLLIPSAFFFVLTCLLLIHKIVGSFVNRSIYAFQKYEIAKRNRLMFVTGCTLLGFGFGVESKLLSLAEKALF